jgi:serine/threonine protein kinase/tetratricopeptide (TPR) repeat protein
MNSEKIAVAPAAAPCVEVLARGATIGRYMVLGLVGRGGMGEVYAAYDPELDRKVAVKLVRAQGEGVDASQGRVRLLREAQAIAKLSHPNVVVVYDVGTVGDRIFIAMEFVDGNTVGYWLQAGQRRWQEVLAVYMAAGRGLEAAHHTGFVHRDFKPENVMVAKSGDVRVMDFGLARSLFEAPDAQPAAADAAGDPEFRHTPSDVTAEIDPESTMPNGITGPVSRTTSSHLLDSKLTQTGVMLGTPAYMAPEQFAGRPTDARADQFSFCVALYEGLYGHRPFEGKTPADLMSNVFGGRIREPPANTKVPTWLRRVVLRGLHKNPAERHESMGALLAALAHDPVKSRQRWFATAGTVMAISAALGATTVAWRASHDRGAMCRAGAGKLAGVWEGSGIADSPRKSAIHRAFAATGAPYAETAFKGARQLLDKFADAWTTMYRDTCEATHVRGEQSAEVLDLRMSCLSERLGRMKALTDVFAQANASVVENAVVAASSLPTLDRCTDVKLLRAVIPPPDDPRVRARVDALRQEVAHVKALGDSGQCSAAASTGRKLIADAKSVGYLPLEAAGLNALARSGSECMSADESIEAHRRAILAATAAHDAEASAESMILLAHTQVERTSDVAQARNWIDLAGATLEGMNKPNPLLDSWRLETLGRVVAKEGKPEEALTTFRKAQELMEKIEGREGIETAKLATNIGLVLEEMDRYQDALVYFERSEKLIAKLLGPDHPLVADALFDRGETLNALQLYDQARAPIERALEIWRRAGSASFFISAGLTNLGQTLLGQGKPRDAQTVLKEALRVMPSGQVAFLPATQFAMARALWANPEERPHAVRLAEAAKVGSAQSIIRVRAADIDAWLSEHRVH